MGSDVPEMKQLLCIIPQLSNISKKSHKKLYVLLRLNNHGPEEENSFTTCSYTSSSSQHHGTDSFFPKDEMRSRYQFRGFSFGNVVLRVEVFAKQTMSRKIIGTFECDVTDFIKNYGNGKETLVNLNPSGKCSLVLEIIPSLHEQKLVVDEAPSLNQPLQDREAQPIVEFPNESQGELQTVIEKTHLDEVELVIDVIASDSRLEVTPPIPPEEEPMEPTPKFNHQEILSETPVPHVVEESLPLQNVESPVIVQITPNRISFEKIELDPEKERFERPEDNSARPTFGSLNRQNSGRKKRDSGESEGSLTRQSSIRSRKSDDIDHRHAVSGSDSRVSSALIRQLSGKIDTTVTDQIRCRGESSRNLLQVAALSWLEQQITEEDNHETESVQAVQSPIQTQSDYRSLISPEPTRKSPVPSSDSKSSSQKKTQRTPFSHSYSTVLEDRDDATTSAISKLFEGEILSPRSNDDSSSSRRTPPHESKSNPRITKAMASLELSPSPDSRLRSIKRRQSISTTAPRAYFDCDSDSDDQNHDQEQVAVATQPNLISRFSAGKLTVPSIQIDTDNLDSPIIAFEDDEKIDKFSPPSVTPSRRLSLGGQGIRRRNSVGVVSSTKRGRRSLSTIRSVQSWDDRLSAADAVKANMQELIQSDETFYDDFLDLDLTSAGGVVIWTVNMKQLSRVEDGSGIYYNGDCYLILATSNSPGTMTRANSKQQKQPHLYSIFTWTGSKSERDKGIIVAFKAQHLSKYLGGIHIQHNREGEESDEFFEAILGNFEVVDGTSTESSLNILEKSSSYRGKNPEISQPQARLLLVTSGSHAVLSLMGGGGSPAATEVPALRSIPIQRSSLQSQFALIFDTGDELIFQWRGTLASQVARARVFEAALSLRSERIKQNPGCRLEVVDENSEPDYFWELFEEHSTSLKRFPSKVSSFGDDVHSNLDEDEEVENHSSDEGDGDHRSAATNSPRSPPLVMRRSGSMSSHLSSSHQLFPLVHEERENEEGEDEQEKEEEVEGEDDGVYYDLDEIKDYCNELIDGHSEMQRRQVISHSRILDPNLLSDIVEDEEEDETNSNGKRKKRRNRKSSLFYDSTQLDVNLYRIGYVDGELHTSRLSGINSNGDNLGRPKKEMLESKGVYILDYNEEVYVWIGRLSPTDLRVAGMTVAKALVEHCKDKMIKVDSVSEGHEPILFKAKFPDWYETDLQLSAERQQQRLQNKFEQTMSRSPSLSEFGIISKSLIDSSVKYMTSHQQSQRQQQRQRGKSKGFSSSLKRKQSQQIVIRSKISLHENHLYDDILERDNGAGVTVVWIIVGNELKPVPKHEHGHFWTHEAYVILYGFTPTREGGDRNKEGKRRKMIEGKNGEGSDEVEGEARDEEDEEEEDENENTKPQFILYFWQGSHTKEKAYPQWKLSILPQKQEEWLKQMGEIPHEIRVHQGKEPLHFFRIFKHRYIVHIAFLEILRMRASAEEKVKRVQHEILKQEKLRAFQHPHPFPAMIIRRATGVFSPTNSRILLNAARTSSPGAAGGGGQSLHHRSPIGSPERKGRHQLPHPFARDGSFSTLETSVADDLTGHTPLGRSQYRMERANGVLLFQVKGSGLIDDDVHAVQVEACANRLNSSDCFIAVRPSQSKEGKSFVWLWVGRGSQFFEQEAAGSLAIKLMKWIDHSDLTTRGGGGHGNQVRVVEEGAGEWFNRWIAKSFYRALGGFCLYSNFDLLQTPRYLRPFPLRYPQLFVCEYVAGEYSITMLERFTQTDLQAAGAAILEAHYAIFVWHGRNCNTALSVTCKKVAQKFLGALRKGNCAVDRTVIEIQQDQETAPFISCFHGWCDWELLTKPYIDPRKVRLDVRQTMGLMGDMKASQGKPIEGLTTEQHQILAEEFKRRQQKMKEKEMELKLQTQHESVRVKIRQGHLQYELEHRPPPVEVKEVKKFVADASYNSPVCVPPPFAIAVVATTSSGLRSPFPSLSLRSHSPCSLLPPSEPAENSSNPEESSQEPTAPLNSSASVSPVSISGSAKPSNQRSRSLIAAHRSKSFNNLRRSPSPSPSPSASSRYQQMSIGKIELKATRSHSSNSLLSSLVRSPSSFSSPSLSSAHNKGMTSASASAWAISISERIRNARPQLTSRDRVNLLRTSPMRSSSDLSSPQGQTANRSSVGRKESYHSSPSYESSGSSLSYEESITARIHRQREELSRMNYSPPSVAIARKQHLIQRQNTPPSPSHAAASHPNGAEGEKKEKSITRLLAAAGLQRQRRRQSHGK